jgi:methyl-accepting chemotaxis protein
MITTKPVLVTLALALAALGPATARAQTRTATTSADALTAQERELVALATDVSRRTSDVMERWIATKEVSEERLFNFLYYPIPKTDPPRFNTDYDKLSDRDFPTILEAALRRSDALVFVVVVDKNGYLPTHNLRYAQPLTGNNAVDLVNNRAKRLFRDRTGFQAARNEAPFLLQRYQRDTGEILGEIDVPLVVRGLRWGTVRIGFRPVEGR